MKILRHILSLVMLCSAPGAFAQGTAFTYQGRLNDGAAPAHGLYDLLVVDYSAPTGGSSTAFNLVTNVGVTNGLFTVTLDLSELTFPGADRWLELGVRTNGGGGFTTLSPRQQVTSTPYAIRARHFSGTISNAQLSGTYSGPVTFSSPSNVFSGTFSGSGAGLTNLNAWQLGGNSSTTPGADFIGTTDNQPVEIKVNGQRALRLEPNAGGAPNLIGGHASNSVGLATFAATIGGGSFNTITTNASYAVIGGGFYNKIGFERDLLGYVVGGTHATISGGLVNFIGLLSSASVISGGNNNTVQGNVLGASIGGGVHNTIQSLAGYSTIAGGTDNDIGTNSLYNLIGGGRSNQVVFNALFSTVAGGFNNRIGAYGDYATIPGGSDNFATNYAFAAGRRAKAVNSGAFVWADSQNADFASTAANQFLIRAAGGVGIGTNNPAGAALAVVGGIRTGVNGTIQSRVQYGTTTVGTGTNGVNTFTITFPSAFTGTPKVFVAAKGIDAPDTFVINTRAVTTTQFKVNILRVDAGVGWGQALQVDWYAVE